MLKEITKELNYRKDHFQRWFSDDQFDLYIWYDHSDPEKITGFQLCYDKYKYPRALSWFEKEGFSHHAVDEGETPGRAKKSPILIADGIFQKEKILSEFIENSKEIPESVRNFISSQIRNY